MINREMLDRIEEYGRTERNLRLHWDDADKVCSRLGDRDKAFLDLCFSIYRNEDYFRSAREDLDAQILILRGQLRKAQRKARKARGK